MFDAQSLEGRLLFAVPKKGRLSTAALNLLEGADLRFKREHRLDIALVQDLPVALVFLPAADISTAVCDGRVDLGITGWDQLQEHHARARASDRCEPVMDLGFGACKLQLQVPIGGEYRQPWDLVGRTVGTSFGALTEEYFARMELGHGVMDEKGRLRPDIDIRLLRTRIIHLSGSVEAACTLGVADGVVDLVESGETMRAAGLKAIDTIVESSAWLIASKHTSKPELKEVKELIAARIGGVITAQKYVLCQYNIEREYLAAATEITPGGRAPTVTSLEGNGWVAVSVMVEKKRIAQVMDQLMKVGASDILVLDIKNTRNT